MHIFKKWIAMAIVVACVISLAACGGNESNKGNPNDATMGTSSDETEGADSQNQEQEDSKLPVNGEITEELLRSYPETPASEFTYVMSSDYEGILIQSYSGTSDIVVIPGTIDGQPVVDIGEYVFANSSPVRAVLIPETVIEIGELFTNSECIEIVIAEGVQFIRTGCFVNCKSLREVILGDELTEFGVMSFSDCEKLEKVIISASLTEMSDDAKNTLFFACPNVTIYGETGSYIETVANEKRIPFVAE